MEQLVLQKSVRPLPHTRELGGVDPTSDTMRQKTPGEDGDRRGSQVIAGGNHLIYLEV